YHVRGDKRQALACFLKSIDCDRDFSEAYVAAGRLYAVDGELDQAWKCARDAERLGNASLFDQLSRYLNPPAASGQ
ncbi:MAG: hypothetical protein ACRD2O_09175, partial [Terriglobia bacterium]